MNFVDKTSAKNGLRVAIVGAGFGGLAAAMLLSARGAEVTVFESAPAPGGKATRDGAFSASPAEVEVGPTVFTMKPVLDALFEGAGTSIDAHLRVERARILARHAWPDGTQFDLLADEHEAIEEVRRVFGDAAARAYATFRGEGARLYETVREPFLASQAPSSVGALSLLRKHGLAAFRGIDAFRTMHAALSARFDDPRLVQLFGRYATYCGSSPYEAPATLNLVSHVESMGVWRIAGGMHELARAMEAVAAHHGARFRYESAIAKIHVEKGRASAVELANGERFEADAVVFNGDVSAVRDLLDAESRKAPAPIAAADRSLSAVTWAMVARTSGFALQHHNVFFSNDYAREFEELRNGRTPEEPTVYLCAQDRNEETPAKLADERMLVIVNAPPTGEDPSQWTESEKKRCTANMMKVLARAGLSLEVAWTRVTTPLEWATRFPRTGGALYGRRASGPFSSLQRHGAKTNLPGLYLTGGSVHPGAGVPMAVISGQLAVETIWEAARSRSLSPRVATVGTTSTA